MPPLRWIISAVLALGVVSVCTTSARTSNTFMGSNTCVSAGSSPEKAIVLVRGDRPDAGRNSNQINVINQLHFDHATNVVGYHIIDAVAATITKSTACDLTHDPAVEAVVPDRLLRPTPGENLRPKALTHLTRLPAGTVTEPESLRLTGALTAQSTGDHGQGVLVADIDSGIDTTQPNLQGVLATSSTGQPLYKDFTGTGLVDAMGHGTGTAGMMVSQGTTAYRVSTTPYYGPISGDPTVVTTFRVLGMAPAAKLIVAKVVDPRLRGGGGYESWIVSAIQWVVDNHAQVINESFGWQDIPTDMPDPVAMADEAAARASVIVCVAAGNSGPGFGTVADPAADELVVSVGASTMFRDMAQDGYLAPYGKYASDSLASFSSRGPTTDGAMSPDLLAPGENGWSVFAITGPAAGAGVGLFGGTSQAAPIVAGAAALVISAYQKKYGTAPPNGYVKQLLMNTADDLGFGAEDQSAGRVDVARAVAAIEGSGPDIAITPSYLSFAGGANETVQRSIVITNDGHAAATIGASVFTEEQTATRTFAGTTPASQTGQSTGFSVAVAPGTQLLRITAIWRTGDQQPLVLQAFDPNGRLVNYAGGAGIDSLVAAHPLSGKWEIYVGNQNAKSEPFQLQVVAERYIPVGSVTPPTATIAPGKSATLSVSLPMPSAAGRVVDTLTITLPGGTETVPAIATVNIPAQGQFAGAFTAPSSTGLDAEIYTYDFVVPATAKSLGASVSWPRAGNGVELFLVNPSHKRIAHSVYSLTSKTTQVSTTTVSPGTWEVIVTCPVFDGLDFGLPYQGSLTIGT